MKKSKNRESFGIVDEIKSKLFEIGIDYLKRNVENSKREILRYIEKNIEIKIKREIEKISIKLMGGFFVGLGVFFLLYGLIAALIYVLQLPTFTANIIFGLLFAIIGLIIYSKSF